MLNERDVAAMQPKRDRHWRVIRHSIETEMRTGAIKKALITYFEDLGYANTQTSPSLIFERGAPLVGMFFMSPDAMQTKVSADIINMGGTNTIELVYRVNVLGRLPLLPADVEFWQAEIEGVEAAVHFGYFSPAIAFNAAERTRWQRAALVLFVALALVLGRTLLATFAGI